MLHENIENVDSFGISYFKSHEAAFNYGCMTAEFKLTHPSLVKLWYPSGSLEFEGQHVCGQLYGDCKWYYDRNTENYPLIVSRSGSYNFNNSGNSRTVGVWRTFYETGKPHKIETFDNTGVLNGYGAEYNKFGEIQEYEYCSRKGKLLFIKS